MEIKGPLIKGSFIERPNRFITIVKVGKKSVKSHLSDPGRLREILTPGRELYLWKAIESEHRKTDYSTILAKYNGELVSLVTALPNQFVKECIDSRILLFLKDFELVKPEVVHGNHRYDFLLKDKSGDLFYLEVKSVTYVENFFFCNIGAHRIIRISNINDLCIIIYFFRNATKINAMIFHWHPMN